jgi:hypothetical protein
MMQFDNVAERRAGVGFDEGAGRGEFADRGGAGQVGDQHAHRAAAPA